jgi:hypothetical protein
MYSHSTSRLLTPPPPPPAPLMQRDPKRQSQMLMESKRRSLAIKDTDLLEQMLRGDLEGFEQYQPSDDDEEEAIDSDEEENGQETLNNSKESIRSSSPSTIIIEQEELINDKKGTSSTTLLGLPCTFESKLKNPIIIISKKDDPFALFTGVTMILGIASQLGISDDWTVPITLATLVSGFLWSGNKNKKNNNSIKKN